MDTDRFDATLATWSDVQHLCAGQGLLLGNGASRAIWGGFAYFSLFEQAVALRSKPLNLSDQNLFKSLGTESFERVLSALSTTIRANAALAISSTAPLNRYYSIKEALIHAVRRSHIPWALLPTDHLARLNDALRHFGSIFTSNYDLLVPWAVKHAQDGFDELFRADQRFDLSDTRPRGRRVYYLHGGLHLVRHGDGSTRQRPAEQAELLEGFAINISNNASDGVPLVVSEGSNEDKLRTVRNSDYLSWCLAQLAGHEGALCILGHHLGPQDCHLVQAIEQARVTDLVISVHPMSEAAIISQKNHYSQLFVRDDVRIHFFDASTHPLTMPDLKVRTA